jgi:ParB family chromosome partitioning protein
MNFLEDYPIAELTPAPYNPREISSDAFEWLKYSVKKFGIVKPVIINGADGTLTAGHQRTKAMKAVGITHLPAMRLPSVNRHDEINFNLQHNKIEENKSIVKIKSAENLPFGFSIIKSSQIEVINFDNSAIIQTIAKLLAKYGEWGSVVIDEEGNVIENSEYACATKTLQMDLVVYKMENSLVKEFLEIMRKDYGEYKYENLGIKPYNQTHCQMHRLTSGVRSNSSTTYENLVLPNLKKGQRLVDFGAGEQAYAKMLKSKGFPAFAYEPHPKVKGSVSFDIPLVVQMIRAIQKDVATNGLYDVVVLDSVINSITSQDFEHYVMTVCNALCAKNGVFYSGTRAMEKCIKQESVKVATSSHRYIEFFDKNNFTAAFRQGVWTLQKLHTKESFIALLSKYFEFVEVDTKQGNSMHHAYCHTPKMLPMEYYKKALTIEFNMEYPNGYRHNQHEKLVETILEKLCNR